VFSAPCLFRSAYHILSTFLFFPIVSGHWQVLFLKDIVGLGFERKTPVREVLNVFDSTKRLHYISKNEKLGNVRIWERQQTTLKILFFLCPWIIGYC